MGRGRVWERFTKGCVIQALQGDILGGKELWQGEGTERGVTEPPEVYTEGGGDEDLSFHREMMGREGEGKGGIS